MYSLTQATEIFIKHYNIWNTDIHYEVLRYNTHKLRHSNGVLEIGRNLIIKILENQFILPETINRAEIVFFLHDLGRFYQNNKERILTNSEFEHGNMSAKIAQDEWYDEKICLAIKYHNKYNLDWLYNEESFQKMNLIDKNETEFLSKIIRDADKLQNMIYIIFDREWLSRLNWALQKWMDIDNRVIEDLQNHMQVDRKNMISIVDELVGNMGRIFDINFQESINMLEIFWYTKKVLQSARNITWVSEQKIKIIENIFKNYHK